MKFSLSPRVYAVWDVLLGTIVGEDIVVVVDLQGRFEGCSGSHWFELKP